jgi:hypothetical protein
LVWWDYVLTDRQPVRVQRWLVVSAVVATLPFVAFIVRQVMDYFGGGGKRPAVYGKTAWANHQDMRSSSISGSARSRASGPVQMGTGWVWEAAGEERDRCSALGAARQPSRNGTSVPLKVTADFAVAPEANSSMSAVRAC